MDRENIDLQDNKKDKKRALIFILIILSIICLVISLVIIFGGAMNLTPLYPTIDNDENIIKMNDDETKLKTSKGGGSVGLIYQTDVTIHQDKKDLTIMFQNPSKSTEDMVLQIYVKQKNKDVLISESKLIPSGYMIKKLNLKNKVSLLKGKYKGYFKVAYYNPSSKELAMVNTTIPVSMIVK